MFAEAIQASLILDSQREGEALEHILSTPRRWLLWLWSKPLEHNLRNAEQLLTFLRSDEWHLWSDSDLRQIQHRLSLLVRMQEVWIERAKGLPFIQARIARFEELNEALDSYVETIEMSLDPAYQVKVRQLVKQVDQNREPRDWRHVVGSMDD